MDKKTLVLTLLVLLVGGVAALGDDEGSTSPQNPNETTSSDITRVSGVPIFTGYGGFISNFQKGQQGLEPVIAPIILIPVGSKGLIEAEGEFEGSYDHMTGEPWEHHWDKGLEYLQFNYEVNKDVTVVVGRFLTPFGIFNERLHPIWVKNMLNAPFIGGLEMSSGNGVMLRGGIRVASNLDLNYASFFSAATNRVGIEATRGTGGRVGFFLPRQRLELGASFERTLQDEHANTYGFDLTYQLIKIPLDLRGEYVHTPFGGSGYWLEGAYRLRRVQFARRFMRKSQAVVRWQQFAAPGESMSDEGDMEMPEVNTREIGLGWNYYLRDGFKVAVSYGRQFSPMGDTNVVTLGVGYRLFFPFGGAK